ncbi:FecR family protein [Gabonibacter chumensis]|uniref:FecR family protein n=1 Tax=Gabonibacter chumensis TaxID=2972474 RepID=UPI002572C274|nr:FecR domain-containing protein [Gabonibacter chumensis]MCR9011403.1 FecR domain-containing protein [Gabonibacter chumensis]
MQNLKKYYSWAQKIAHGLLNGGSKWREELKEETGLREELEWRFSPDELRKGLEIFREIDGEEAIVRIKNRLKRNRLRRWSMVGVNVAAVLACGFFVVLWMNEKREQRELWTAEKWKTPYLLVGESKKIDLFDSLTIVQRGVVVENRAGGKLSYRSASVRDTEEPVINKLVVPKGCEYYVELADGTKVWLNAESELSYPVSFNAVERDVELRGEAYFEVTKSEVPFVVKTGNMDVRVLGTAFNVMAYADESNVEVTLEEGSVRIHADDKETLLSPGQQAVFEKTDSILRIKEVNTKIYTGWRSGEFLFEGESLERVGRKLARWYDMEIVVDSVLCHRSLNGSLKRYESIREFLDVLELTNEVKVNYREDRVEILSKKE